MQEWRYASLPNSNICRVVAATTFQESYFAVDWLAVGSILVHHVQHDARTCSLFYGGFGRRTLAFTCIPWSELDASQHCFLYTHMWSGGVVWSRLCIHCSSTSWIELEQSCWTLATWINGISRGFYYGRRVNNSDALSFLWFIRVLGSVSSILLFGLRWHKSVPMLWDRCKKSLV